MYLLDSNVFIDASRRYYHADIAPTFWDWLAAEHAKGVVGSIAAVQQEINDGDAGHLTTWAAGLPVTFWQPLAATSVPSMSLVAAWTMHPDRAYRQAAQDEFLRVADSQLVAQAHAGGHTVVTSELPAPQSKKRVVIPDACRAMGVPCMSPFDLYRSLGLRFS